jgi:outer membrane lipoprotein-sorting protein
VWLDKQDWTPHRIVVTDKWLGSIEVVLKSLETTDVPPVDPKLAAAK